MLSLLPFDCFRCCVIDLLVSALRMVVLLMELSREEELELVGFPIDEKLRSSKMSTALA